MAEITKVALKVDNNTSFPNNNGGLITPAILRAFNVNMIDSLVDEIPFGSFTSSVNTSLNALNVFTASATGLTTGSLLITASAAGNVITFTKGNNTTFNVTVATGSVVDISNLNQATASLQAFTQSAQISINNLNTTTASLNTSVTNINAFTASPAISITNLNANSASQQVSIDSINSKTGSFATTGSNTFISANTFTSISASSFISASQFVGDGSKLTGLTSSISMPILDEGIPQGNAVSLNFTGSAISATVAGGVAIISVQGLDTGSFNAYTASTNSSITQLNANTASQQVSIDNLNLYTSSFNTNTLVTTASFNSYTSSNNQRVSSLETNSASVNTSISALNTYTASQSTASLVTSINNLNTFSASALISISNLNTTTASLNTSVTNLNSATASLFTSASLALVTVSFDTGTRNLTFTKGDTTTFAVNIPDVSGSVGGFATLGANTFTGSQTISSSLSVSGSANFVGGDVNFTDQGRNINIDVDRTIIKGQKPTLISSSLDIQGSLTASLANGYVWVGDATNHNVEITTASFASSASFNSYTSSNDQKVNSLISATGSYATTGSNSFNGNQIITGSVTISGSSTTDLTVVGQIFVSSSATGGTTAPKITVSGSAGTSTINRNSITTKNTTNLGSIFPSTVFVNTISTSDEIGMTIDPGAFGISGWAQGGAIYVNNTVLDTYPAVFGFQNKANYTDGRVAVLTPLSASAGFTASLQNGYAWVGNSLGQNTQVATSSFGTPIPSGTISGSAQITALGFVSSSVTASSLVTASVNLNTITFTKGDSSTFALTVNTGSGGGGAAFPFVGDAVITGSLTISGSSVPDIRLIGNIDVTGSLRGQPITLSVASSTASLNMTEGNNFILTLPSSSTTHINATNIVPGQTLNLLIKQQIGPATGSITFAPTIFFPSGVDMQATQTGSAIDLVSMISFDTTNLMAANVKNLK